MRRPPYHRDERGRLDVKMTPMIDVIFLLLIFFVSTASFQAVEEALPANLSWPGSGTAVDSIDLELEDLDEIIVKILWQEGRPGWRVELPGQQSGALAISNLKQLRGTLSSMAGLRSDLPVILDVQGEVPIENVIDVYDACRQIGLERIQFAASVEA